MRVRFRIRREGIFQELGTKTALILWITGRFEKWMLKWAKNIRLELQGKNTKWDMKKCNKKEEGYNNLVPEMHT